LHVDERVLYGFCDSYSRLWNREKGTISCLSRRIMSDYARVKVYADCLDTGGNKAQMKRLEQFIHTGIPYLLVLAVILQRLLIAHPPNFVPLFASLLFFAVARPRREYWIPLVGLAAVDVFLTTQQYGYALTADHAITWIWSAAAMLVGAEAMGGKLTALRGMGVALASAVGFFLISNFAVWAVWQMYPHTMSGLAACYAAAVPFFRNSFVAEGVAGAVLFGVAGLVWEPRLALNARGMHS